MYYKLLFLDENCCQLEMAQKASRDISPGLVPDMTKKFSVHNLFSKIPLKHQTSSPVSDAPESTVCCRVISAAMWGEGFVFTAVGPSPNCHPSALRLWKMEDSGPPNTKGKKKKKNHPKKVTFWVCESFWVMSPFNLSVFAENGSGYLLCHTTVV